MIAFGGLTAHQSIDNSAEAHVTKYCSHRAGAYWIWQNGHFTSREFYAHWWNNGKHYHWVKYTHGRWWERTATIRC